MLDVCEDMRAAGVKPDVYSYNSLITTCEKGKQWQKAFEVCKDIRADGVKPNVITYSSLISACGKGGQMAVPEGV